MSDPRKIALFGGTFDPVHLGHVHLASLAVAALKLDQVRFMPCHISPHKTQSAPTPAVDRLKMLRLATSGLSWAVVDDFEAARAKPSYSYQTAEEMAARFPGARLFWIMGVDQWKVLPQWAESERLARVVEFIVFARGNSPVPREGYRMHPLEGIHPASATQIRESISRGEMDHPWLDPAVARWICQHRIYQKA